MKGPIREYGKMSKDGQMRNEDSSWEKANLDVNTLRNEKWGLSLSSSKHGENK